MKTSTQANISSSSKGLALLVGVFLLLSAVLVALLAARDSSDDGDDGDRDFNNDPLKEELGAEDLAFSGAAAYGFVKAQTDFGPRPVGTLAHEQTALFLEASLEAFGLEVKTQEFSGEFDGVSRTFTNVIGRLPAKDPASPDAAKKDVIIFGAHYDTRDIAEHDPDPGKRNTPILGANDGGSGVAVLLELARVLSKMELSSTLEFVFFDGEDFEIAGEDPPLAGSTYHAKNLEKDARDRLFGMVLVDMVGDTKLEIKREVHSTDRVLDGIFGQAAKLDFAGFRDENGAQVVDDHLPYIQEGLPAVALIDIYFPEFGAPSYWHTTQDTLDKISGESLAVVGKTLELFVYNHSAYLRKDTFPNRGSYGLESASYRASLPGDEIVSSSDLALDVSGSLEMGSLSLEGPLVLENLQFLIHDKVHIGSEPVSRAGDRIILRNCSFISGAVTQDFYADIGPRVTLDNCSFIFNNEMDSSIFPDGRRKFGVGAQGSDMVFNNVLIKDSPGYGAFFMDSRNIQLKGGLVTGCKEGGLEFINATGHVTGLEARDNLEFGICLATGSAVWVEDSNFANTQLGEVCTSCGPLPAAPGIWARNSELHVENSFFTDNHVGVKLENSWAEVANSNFSGNSKGLDMDGSQLTAKNNSFQDCEEGLVSEHSALLLESNSFARNQRAVTLISSPEDSVPVLEGNRFVNDGFAISLWSSTVRVWNNSITGAEYGMSLTSPREIEVSSNQLANVGTGIFLTSLYNRENVNLSGHHQEIFNNSFRDFSAGISLSGALNLTNQNNSFLQGRNNSREWVQQWRLDITILNESIGTQIVVKQGDLVIKDTTLQSGENFRSLVVDEYWLSGGERTELKDYTVTVTRPPEGEGDPTEKSESIIVDTHTSLVVGLPSL